MELAKYLIECKRTTSYVHLINQNGDTRSRVWFILNKSKPETLKKLQAWVGTSNFLRRYIENYAEIVQSLYDIMDLNETA